MIYLDNNATTAADPEVCDAVFSSLSSDNGNPSSSHRCGRSVSEAVGHNRAVVADLIGCSPEEVFFTSGGTESNNLALIGSALAQGKGHIVISSVEHPSVSNTCRHLETLGFIISRAPVSADGIVQPDNLIKAMRSDTFMISVMHSNNETGAIQPIEQIGIFARERGIVFHTDAAQSIGKTPFSVGNHTDMTTIVSHKFYGPKGIGALHIRKGIKIKPILFGAGHEQGLRPGTENVSGIAGLAKACELAKRDLLQRIAHTSHLTKTLYRRLKALLPDIALNAERAPRLPNTLSVRIPGVRAVDLVEALKDQVAFSAGSACHAGLCTPSHVLKQMGLSDEEALSTIRLSAGKDNTEDEMIRAAELISKAAGRLRSSSS
ncbi:MAG: cysteine desulfurase NifS [Thermodesulfovibrio sp.]|nr:cysteine desulfurase NifS [Thermodesulfovibrio sp.]